MTERHTLVMSAGAQTIFLHLQSWKVNFSPETIYCVFAESLHTPFVQRSEGI